MASNGEENSSDAPPTKKMKASEDDKTTTPAQAALYAGDALWDPSWTEGKGESTLKERSKANDNPDFTLYSSWFCPFAQRAWIAAEESGANYQWIEINPYYVDPKKPGGYTKKAMTLAEKKEKFPDYVAASPRGLVPALKTKEVLLHPL